MTKWQRIGLVIFFLTICMLISYGTKPDLTLKLWSTVDSTAMVMAFVGGLLLIFGKD